MLTHERIVCNVELQACVKVFAVRCAFGKGACFANLGTGAGINLGTRATLQVRPADQAVFSLGSMVDWERPRNRMC